MDVGPTELIIVLLIVLLIFGGAKLPKLARSMGQAAHEFRTGLAHGDDDAKADDKADSPPATADDKAAVERAKVDDPPAASSGT